MSRFHKNFSLAEASLSLVLLLFVSVAAGAFAQENTSADSRLPLVYSVENTGAHYPTPVFPAFEQLPIIRPLPDPFVFFDESPRDDEGHRDSCSEAGSAGVMKTVATPGSEAGSAGATRSRLQSKNTRLAQSLVVRTAPLRRTTFRRRQDQTLVH